MELNNNTIDQLNYSVLGKDVSIKGDLQLFGPTILVGKIEGQVEQRTKDRFIIESGATFEGKLQAHHVLIYGTFNGHLSASGKVNIFPHAQVSGIIEAQNLQISPGAWANIEAHITGSLGNEP